MGRHHVFKCVPMCTKHEDETHHHQTTATTTTTCGVEEHCPFFHAVWRIPVAEQYGHKPPPRPPHDSHRLMVCLVLWRAARRYPHTGRTLAGVNAMSMKSPE